MRTEGRQRLGFFPLPLAEAQRIRKFLEFPATQCAAIDPCIGDGAAFAAITADAPAQRYGIELDSFRAAQASAAADRGVIWNLNRFESPVIPAKAGIQSFVTFPWIPVFTGMTRERE